MEEEELARLQMMMMDQERVIEQYSDLFQDHQRQLDELNKKVDMLKQKLAKYEEAPEELPANERPPHY